MPDKIISRERPKRNLQAELELIESTQPRFGSQQWVIQRIRLLEAVIKDKLGVDIEKEIKKEQEALRKKEIEEENKSKEIMRKNLKIVKKTLKKHFQPVISYNRNTEPSTPVNWDKFKKGYDFDLLLYSIDDTFIPTDRVVSEKEVIQRVQEFFAKNTFMVILQPKKWQGLRVSSIEEEAMGTYEEEKYPPVQIWWKLRLKSPR